MDCFARDILMAVDFWQFSNNPPDSASVAYSITFLIILHCACTRLFLGIIDCICMLYFVPRKKYPPDLRRVSGYEMQGAFE